MLFRPLSSRVPLAGLGQIFSRARVLESRATDERGEPGLEGYSLRRSDTEFLFFSILEFGLAVGLLGLRVARLDSTRVLRISTIERRIIRSEDVVLVRVDSLVFVCAIYALRAPFSWVRERCSRSYRATDERGEPELERSSLGRGVREFLLSSVLEICFVVAAP